MVHDMKSFEKIFFGIFLIWSGIGFAKLWFQLDEQWLSSLSFSPLLLTFLLFCLSWGDFIFILLAFLNLFFVLKTHYGNPVAWKTVAFICFISGIMETFGTLTGIPFGSYAYTNRFGPMIFGVIPLAIPLAWFVVIVSSWEIIKRFLQKGLFIQTFATATLATLIDYLMEPFAWKIRGYWIWNTDDIPIQNYLSWFFLSLVFTFLLSKSSPAPSTDKRPLYIFFSLILTFTLGRLSYGL
jgi:putative membrane protein